jgi:putative transposase
MPAFRLRSKSTPGQTSPVRAAGPRALQLPKLGRLRVRENTGKLTTMLAAGQFHVYAASIRLQGGRWVMSVTGVPAQMHQLRRATTGRHQARVGVDLGVKTLACDEHGRELHTVKGVKAVQHAQARLRLAGQSSRTKRDSAGRNKAAIRLGKVHARVAHLRAATLHDITTELARSHWSVTIEDLNVAGMLHFGHWPGTSPTPRSGRCADSWSTRQPGTGRRWSSRTGGSRRPRRAPGAGMSTRT